MTPLELVLASLASYRLTRLLVVDTLLDDAMDALVRRMPDESKVSYLLSCVFCLGAWCSVGVLLMLNGWGRVGYWIVVAFAVAGVQALLSSVDGALNRE